MKHPRLFLIQWADEWAIEFQVPRWLSALIVYFLMVSGLAFWVGVFTNISIADRRPPPVYVTADAKPDPDL